MMGPVFVLRPKYPDHVWSYDFIFERTTNGRVLPNIEYYLMNFPEYVWRSGSHGMIRAQDVIDELFKLFIFRVIPEHINSDNGPEFMAKTVRKWLSRLGVKTLFIEPGSPW
jgi:transposase InsO family protein